MSSILDGMVTRVVDIAVRENERMSRSERYRNDPVLWAKDIAGVTLWSKQREIGLSLVHDRNVAVKAGHGVGKSLLAAVLICWWVDTRYPNVFVASTAPSQAQVGAILWREVRKLKQEITKRHREYNRRKDRGLPTDGWPDHELPGYITANNEWKLDGGQLLGFGRKPPENKEDDSFQGIHDGAVLAIGDEAVGLTEQMIDALGNITSNQNSRRLLIANPTNPASYFGKLFKQDSGAWKFHTISVLDSPNFTGEADELPQDVLDKLTGPDYVEDKRKEYGEDSPRYKSRVLGEFAYDLGDTLIKTEDVGIAADHTVIPLSDEPVVFGVDVARFGKDASVIYSNQGGMVRLVGFRDGETRVTEIASWVHHEAVDRMATEVRIDANGIGGGVADILEARADRKYTIVEMNSNGVSPDRQQWHNARAYWWDEFRKNLRKGVLDLDPDDAEYEKLHDELTMVEYKFSAQSGGLLIESKDDMRKRGVKSPDFADAVVMACADREYLFNPLPGKTTKKYENPSDMVEIPSYLAAIDSWW